MPIYEFVCKECGHDFEKLRSMSRMDEKAPCPECEGETLRKLSVFAAFSSSPSGTMSAVGGMPGGCCGGGGGCACSMGA
jgi:putative FmdB family regulatory protein